MTLEDFFTLTELKDGLTAPVRVKELIAAMQEEKDFVGKNVGDTPRQWSTVASTIAATENKDCLDLFVHLDGLQFIDRWLQDAQKFVNETGDSFVEESIAELFRALEKLPIDNHKLVSSGIWMTVKNLVGHNSSRVQDRARTLFDSWKEDRDSEAVPLQDIEKVDALCGDGGLNVMATLVEDSGRPECYSQGISPSRGTCIEENSVEHAGDEMMPPKCSDTLQPERIDVQIQASGKTLDHVSMMDDGPLVHLCSLDMLKPVNEDLTIKDDTPIHSLEGNRVRGNCSTSLPTQGTLEGQSVIAGLNQHTDDSQQVRNISNYEKLAVMDISSVGSPLEQRALPLSADAPNGCEFARESDSQEDIDAKGVDPCPKASSFADVRTVGYEGKSEMDDGKSSNDFRTTNQNGECHSDVVQDSSGNKHNLGDSGVVGEAREQASAEAENDSGNDSDFSKLAAGPKNSDVKPDIEPNSVIDPPEVARQVAIEVEGEITDCRERSCSSSEKIPHCGAKQPDSPDSTNGEQNQSSDSPPKEVLTGPNLSAEASSVGEEPFTKVENLGAEQGSCIHDMEFSSVTEAAQEPEATAKKGSCDFDLNQEVYSEDVDRQVNPISTPISIVSASRGAAATGSLVAPLQFEGTLGWKGSAATSAFRPASPLQITEGEKTLFTLGTHNSSKPREDCLDFDLNVAEGSDDNKIVESLPRKQIQMSSGFPSGESSVEASPRKSERLQLDLNRVSDGGDANPSADWGRDGRLFQQRDGLRSPSPSSTSSSMQPALRNIDLNDQPSFLNDYPEHPYCGKSSRNLNVSGGLRADDSVISIMGARVGVNRRNFVPQTLPLPNGRISVPTVDLNLAVTGGVLGLGSASPYVHSSIYGYNGLVPGPAVYGPGGPIPYMVDSRGAPVVPQFMGSASAAALSPAFSQMPYIMSMTSAPSGSNGVHLRKNFDLNSGLMMEDMNTDTTGGLRQLLSEGRSIDEHLMGNNNGQASSCSNAGVGGKRKEADGGWEFYPINYKHHQPSWK